MNPTRTVLCLGAVVSVLLLTPGTAAAAATATVDGVRSTVFADVRGATLGDTCALADTGPATDLMTNMLGTARPINLLGEVRLDSGAVADGRHTVDVWCGDPAVKVTTATVFTGPGSDVYQFLFDIGLGFLTPQ